MKTENKSELVSSINYGSKGITIIDFSDKDGFAGATFTVQAFKNVKAAVNEFVYNKTETVEAKDVRINVYVEQDGANIILHFDDQNISSLITFPTLERWEQFKKKINEFEIEEP